METKTTIYRPTTYNTEIYTTRTFYFPFLNYIEQHHNKNYELDDIKALHLGNSTATIYFKDGFELNIPFKEVFNGNY